MRFLLAALFLVGCAGAEEIQPRTFDSVYWTDGDSGRIGEIDFRLDDVDSPETGGVGAAVGGARCERERELGFEAKAFMVELTKGRQVSIVSDSGTDKYHRLIVHLEVDGQDVAEAAITAGYLKPWPHEGQKALTKKPDWCSLD